MRYTMFKVLMSVLCAVSLLSSGCDKTANESSPAATLPVSVVTLHPQAIVVATDLPGRVSALQVAEVRPQVSGIIQERLFEEGADVQAGEVLYQIDPAICQADLKSAEANLAHAQATVVPARLKKERFSGLVQNSAVSKQENEDAEAAYRQALAEVSLQEATVRNARIRLEYTRVTSPISGRTGRSTVTRGALVTENQADPLVTVQQLDSVYVDVTQSSTEVLRLKSALEAGLLRRTDESHAVVRLKLEDGRDYAETGVLQFADISVNKSTGMVTLRAIFPNPRQELLPGMFVRGVVEEGVDETALLLPQPALIRDAAGNATTYVVRTANTIEQRHITVGRTHGTDWIVLSGLAAGERVVVGGIQNIRAGVAVRIVEPMQAPQLTAENKE